MLESQKHPSKKDIQTTSRKLKKYVGELGHHYGSKGKCDYKDLSIILIEQVAQKNLKFLADRELWWQHQLRVEGH